MNTFNFSIEQIMMKRLYSPWLYPDFMFNLYLFLTNQSGVIDAIRTHFVKVRSFKVPRYAKHKGLYITYKTQIIRQVEIIIQGETKSFFKSMN